MSKGLSDVPVVLASGAQQGVGLVISNRAFPKTQGWAGGWERPWVCFCLQHLLALVKQSLLSGSLISVDLRGEIGLVS